MNTELFKELSKLNFAELIQRYKDSGLTGYSRKRKSVLIVDIMWFDQLEPRRKEWVLLRQFSRIKLAKTFIKAFNKYRPVKDHHSIDRDRSWLTRSTSQEDVISWTLEEQDSNILCKAHHEKLLEILDDATDRILNSDVLGIIFSFHEMSKYAVSNKLEGYYF